MEAIEYLSETQVLRLADASYKVFKRHQHRNKYMVIFAFQHGLRSSELCNLMWDDIDLDANKVYVRRVKGSNPTHQPLRTNTTRALHKIKRDYPYAYVFCSHHGTPLSTRNFRTIIQRLSQHMGLGNLSPHILRHSCGYHLANQGWDTRLIQDYLGHRDINNTVLYTKTNPERYKNFRFSQ